MFEFLVTRALGPDGVDDEPLPGDEGYDAFRVWEAQQDAFWFAYAAREISRDEAFPDLSGMRTDAGLLREVQEAARTENRAAGAKLQRIADFALRRMANPEVGYDQEQMQHAAEAELGVMLGVNPSTASHWVHLALSLTRRLPKIFAALKDGDLSWASVRTIEEESANLNVAQCSRLEDQVLAKAAGRSPSSMRKLTKREVRKLDPDAVRKRREAAVANRGLWIRDEPEGMATLCATMTSEQAHACFDALDAKVNPKAPGDERAIGARRVDGLQDAISDFTGTDPRTPPEPEAAAPTAAEIEHLNRGATAYVPRPALKAAIRRRDKHCRFPGCRRNAMHCDLDHTIAFKPGLTVYTNLACLCRYHHRIKQMPGWHCEQDEHGVLTWTTPTGQRFITRPPPADGEEPPDIAPAPDPDEDVPPF